MNRKKLRTMSAYTKAILKLIDEDAIVSGDDSGDLMKAAKRLYDQKKIDPPEFNPIRAIAKILATASRQDYIENEHKQPVRRRHNYIASTGGKQATFSWFKIEDATPEKMRLSAQNRRKGTLDDVLQLVRDVDYFNLHFNPGDPIEVDVNFTPDIEEMNMPDEYPDGPSPDEDQPEES